MRGLMLTGLDMLTLSSCLPGVSPLCSSPYLKLLRPLGMTSDLRCDIIIIRYVLKDPSVAVELIKMILEFETYPKLFGS